jgi:hypothetical protein
LLRIVHTTRRALIERLLDDAAAAVDLGNGTQAALLLGQVELAHHNLRNMSSDQQKRYLPLKQVAQSMVEFERKNPTPKQPVATTLAVDCCAVDDGTAAVTQPCKDPSQQAQDFQEGV